MNPPDNVSHRGLEFVLEDETPIHLLAVLQPRESPCPKVLNIAVLGRYPPNISCTREVEEAALFSLFHVLRTAKVPNGEPRYAIPNTEWLGVLELLSIRHTKDTIVMRFHANGKGVSYPLACPP